MPRQVFVRKPLIGNAFRAHAGDMATNYRRMACTPEDVFAVLEEGWLFPVWVVGASRMRNVDDDWPAEGSELQHSFGVWPALINDDTTMLEWQPPRHALVGGPLPFAPGELVVLKGLGENLWHKSELGAVKFMPPSVAYPVFELQPSRFPLRGPGSPGSPAIRGGHR